MKRYFKILCFFSAALFLLSACGKKQENRKTLTGFYLNTVITLTVYDASSGEILDHCMALADYYEKMLSRTMEGSDIWNINHSHGAPVAVHDETLELLRTALFYSEMSEGCVDPSVGTLSILWNFGDTNQKKVPSDTEIAEALSHVNYQNIKISENYVSLTDPDACLDLGFIAKGYIADKMKEYLLAKGVESAIINLGGNVLTVGSKPDGTPFKVGIQKPFAPTGNTALSLEISDRSLVSSGNYERYFEKDGILYHHILSTTDGYPIDSGLSQVTIISDKSVDGDALSTLCFILGYEKGKELIDSLPDIEAVFITEDGEIYFSSV